MPTTWQISKMKSTGDRSVWIFSAHWLTCLGCSGVWFVLVCGLPRWLIGKKNGGKGRRRWEPDSPTAFAVYHWICAFQKLLHPLLYVYWGASICRISDILETIVTGQKSLEVTFAIPTVPHTELNIPILQECVFAKFRSILKSCMWIQF